VDRVRLLEHVRRLVSRGAEVGRGGECNLVSTRVGFGSQVTRGIGSRSADVSLDVTQVDPGSVFDGLPAREWQTLARETSFRDLLAVQSGEVSTNLAFGNCARLFLIRGLYTVFQVVVGRRPNGLISHG